MNILGLQHLEEVLGQIFMEDKDSASLISVQAHDYHQPGDLVLHF